MAIVDGNFIPGEIIVGQESGAKYTLRVEEEYDLVSGFENDTIQRRADEILDFTQQNPFGMP